MQYQQVRNHYQLQIDPRELPKRKRYTGIAQRILQRARLKRVCETLRTIKKGGEIIMKFSFEEFEKHFLETVQMFEENAIANMENHESNYLRQAYCDGYLTAINSIKSAFDHSAKVYLMRKEE
jgi:hypothetical protein